MHSAQHSQPSSHTKQQHSTARLEKSMYVSSILIVHTQCILTKNRDIPCHHCSTSVPLAEAERMWRVGVGRILAEEGMGVGPRCLLAQMFPVTRHLRATWTYLVVPLRRGALLVVSNPVKCQNIVRSCCGSIFIFDRAVASRKCSRRK
jgi:hypothetical protein